MIRKRAPKFRPSILESLEDRTVPSTASSLAHVSASAATTGSTAASNMTTRLNQIGTQVNAAYAAFATAVRQAETTLIAPVATPLAPPTTPAAPATAASVAARVTPLLTTLSTGLLAAVNSSSTTRLPGQAAATGLLQAQLNGPGAGSLATEMSSLFAAAAAGSADGTVPQTSLPLLFAAVDSAINASYSATATQIYLFANGQISNGGTGTTGTGTTGTGTTGTTTTGTTGTMTTGTATAFDLNQFGTQVNAAYSTFAAALRQSETTLIGPGTPGTSPATPATVTPLAFSAINTLSQSITTALASTPAAANTGLIQSQFLTRGGAGSLSTQISSLLNSAATGSATNTVPASSLALLFTAVDGAINASYSATAVEGYLLATSPSYNRTTTGTGTGTTGTGTTGTGTGTGTTGTGTGTGVGVGGGTTGTGTGTGVGGTTGTGTTGTGTGGTTGTGTGTGTGVGGTTGTGTGGTTGTGTGVGGTTGTGVGGTTGTGGVGGIGSTGGVGTGTGTGTGTGGIGTTGGTGTGTGGIGTTGGTGTGTGGIGRSGVGSARPARVRLGLGLGSPGGHRRRRRCVERGRDRSSRLIHARQQGDRPLGAVEQALAMSQELDPTPVAGQGRAQAGPASLQLRHDRLQLLDRRFEADLVLFEHGGHLI